MSHQAEIDALLNRVAEEPNISPYLTEAARRAISTTEAEQREKSAASFDSELEAIAEKGARAFFKVAGMRSETAQLLFDAKSFAHDLNQRDYISQAAFDELLLAECFRLTGDKLKAALLASWAKE